MFRYLMCLSLLFSAAFTTSAQRTDSIVVYIFLMEDCPISQNYSLTMQQIYQDYSNDIISFVGVFPNKLSTPETIQAFKEKYSIPFELVVDKGQVITKRFQAKVTPEAIVYDHNTGRVMYRGRIDDMYFALGKRKPKTQNTDLVNALYAILNGETVPVTETEPIGCVITYYP